MFSWSHRRSCRRPRSIRPSAPKTRSVTRRSSAQISAGVAPPRRSDHQRDQARVICLSAGVDLSGVERGFAALLPKAPTDRASYSRRVEGSFWRGSRRNHQRHIWSATWRRGLTDVAIGCGASDNPRPARLERHVRPREARHRSRWSTRSRRQPGWSWERPQAFRRHRP